MRDVIRMAGCHEPPGGTRVAVTAVNPATTTAIAAIWSRSASPGMRWSLSGSSRLMSVLRSSG